MKKRITFFFLLNLLIASTFHVNAQQEFGQVVIGAGVGYSPGFDGVSALGYPVQTKQNADWNQDNYPYAVFNCPTYTMNIGGSIDFGINSLFSVGIAASYQNETMLWKINSNIPGPQSDYPNSDKISRTNIALRFLYHFPMKSKVVDMYTGIRPGISIWHDTPSSSNIAYYYNSPSTFIYRPTMQVFSFQVLFGAQICISNLIGVHVNVGIGSPYLAECGLTVRINTHKDSETPTK